MSAISAGTLLFRGLLHRQANTDHACTQHSSSSNAPASHCTGDQAIEMFQEAYGDDFIQSGVGYVIVIEPLSGPDKSQQ